MEFKANSRDTVSLNGVVVAFRSQNRWFSSFKLSPNDAKVLATAFDRIDGDCAADKLADVLNALVSDATGGQPC